MPQISVKTLVLAVQAIDGEIDRMRSLDVGDIGADDEALLLQYELAADELEDVYAEAARSTNNLPLYADLVRQDDEPGIGQEGEQAP